MNDELKSLWESGRAFYEDGWRYVQRDRGDRELRDEDSEGDRNGRQSVSDTPADAEWSGNDEADVLAPAAAGLEALLPVGGPISLDGLKALLDERTESVGELVTSRAGVFVGANEAASGVIVSEYKLDANADEGDDVFAAASVTVEATGPARIAVSTFASLGPNGSSGAHVSAGSDRDDDGGPSLPSSFHQFFDSLFD